MPRHRIVCSYLSENKALLEDGEVIMFGAEYAIEVWLQNQGIKYTTADLFDKTADIKVDLQNTPFENNTWHAIICNHVLEHIPDLDKALKELYRILKKEGVLELTMPTDRSFEYTKESTPTLTEQERIDLFGQIDHMRIFGNDVQNILTNAGFAVQVYDGETLPTTVGAKIGPANYDDNRVYLCTKRS